MVERECDREFDGSWEGCGWRGRIFGVNERSEEHQVRLGAINLNKLKKNNIHEQLSSYGTYCCGIVRY